MKTVSRCPANQAQTNTDIEHGPLGIWLSSTPPEIAIMIIVALYIVIPARHAREQRTGKTGPQVELADYVGPVQDSRNR